MEQRPAASSLPASVTHHGDFARQAHRGRVLPEGPLRIPGRLLPLLFLFFPVLPASVARADEPFTVSRVPNPRSAGGWVSDPAARLSPADATSINALIAHIEKKTGAEIAVVVLPSVGDTPAKDFATELFNTWHIGKKGKDNGLLLLIVLDQRRWEFETGYGLEGDLPDAVCRRIGEEHLVPALRANRMGDGIYASISAVARKLGAPPEDAEEPLTRSSGPGDASGRMPQDSADGADTPGTVRAFIRSDRGGPLTLIGGLSLYSIIGIALAVRRGLRNRNLGRERASDPYQHYQALRQDHGPGFYVALVLFPLPMLILLLVYLRSLRRIRNTPRLCTHCQQPMAKLDEKADDLFLEEGRRKEEELGSVDYDVWHCNACDRVKIFSYDATFTSYSACTACSFKTYHCVEDRTIVSPTCHSSGSGEREYRCENCGHTATESYTIPRRDCSKSSSGGWSSSGSSGSSSSGGSFGGGSSGGGGSGGSW